MIAATAQAQTGSDLLLRLTGDAEVAATLDDSEVVRQLYANAEGLLTGSGHEVAIEISDAHTLYPDSFQLHDWTDLVTHEGRWLQLEKTHLQPTADERVVHVGAVWMEEASSRPYKASERFTVADAAALFDRDDSGQQSGHDNFLKPRKPLEKLTTLALTAYRVELQMAGEALQYRAAIFWRERASGEIELSIQDNVLTPLDLIAFEDREPTPHGDIGSLVAAHSELLEKPSPSKAGCLATQTVRNHPLRIMADSTNHDFSVGEHGALLEVKVTEVCAPGCYATCTPMLKTQVCYDQGTLFPGRKHKVYKAATVGYGSGTMSATCGGGLQCAFKECIIGFCGGGIGVGISWNGVSFSFGNTINDLVTFNLQDTSSMGCLQLPPAPPPDPPGCGQVTTEVELLAFDDGAPAIELPADTFTLRREEPSKMVHQGEPVTYVLGEWALVGLAAPTAAAGPQVDLKRVSSAAFGLAKRDAATQALHLVPSLADATSQTALIVEYPAHGENSRAIPMPGLELGAIDRAGALDSGRILVRADFGEDRELQDFEVLYGTLGIDDVLHEEIRTKLSLSYQDENNHRVIAFAVLDVGETVQIRRSLKYMPKCCCGSEFCV